MPYDPIQGHGDAKVAKMAYFNVASHNLQTYAILDTSNDISGIGGSSSCLIVG